MEINRTNVIELVNKTNTKPDKDYGQNFLIDPTISSKICEYLEVDNTEKVLEIGPGLGSLTHFLFDKCLLTVCDIDRRMIDFLKIFYKDDINYILNDARKIELGSYDKIICNLPYNITTELVTDLLIKAINCKKMVLMCQSEAFNRFYDLSGEHYGPVSILLHLLGESKKLLVVKPGSFYPSPKINSLVFSFEYHPKTCRESTILVFKMCKSLFLNRRKTIYNNLKNYLGDADRANQILAELKVDTNTRPDFIKPETYLLMYQLIQKKI